MKMQNVNTAEEGMCTNLPLNIKHDIQFINVKTFISHTLYDVAAWLTDKSPEET
jgi:hypothetical protein